MYQQSIWWSIWNDIWSDKIYEFTFVMTQHVIWAKQKSESFGYAHMYATYDITCFPTFVGAAVFKHSVKCLLQQEQRSLLPASKYMLIAKQVLIQQVEKQIYIQSEFFKEKHNY